MSDDFPAFLQNSDAFASHLDDQFSELENAGRGDAFLEFALRLMPFCDFWSGFSHPQKSAKKTHDKGVDYIARKEDQQEQFCGQSKYRIREVAEFDQVVSKFKNYESSFQPVQQSFSITEAEAPSPLLRFVVVTSTNLKSIVAKYEESSLPSRADFQKYRADNRFKIVDGPRLLQVLQALYRRSYLLAPQVTIELTTPFVKAQNVYVSIISGKTLYNIYEKHGASIFFENIRDFIGVSGPGRRESVNDEIADTLRSAPDKMLGRNNGVTLKAESIEEIDDRHLSLAKCSIVNGCQTTMSVVQAGPSAFLANVLIKIVASNESWDVAKAANYQNNVSRIELDLARFLRPQLVTKIATDVGYGAKIPNVETVSNVLEAVHTQKISYDSMKHLYLGLFSRFPNNLFESNYSELRLDVLNKFYENGKADHLMGVLFKLLHNMETSSAVLRKRFEKDQFVEVFGRFFQEEKTQYRCLLAILASYGCTNEEIVTKPPQVEEAYMAMQRFVRKLQVVLEVHPSYFERVFMHAFVAVAQRVLDSGSDGTAGDLSQRMWREVNTSAGNRFPNLLGKLHFAIKSDDSLVSATPDFSGI